MIIFFRVRWFSDVVVVDSGFDVDGDISIGGVRWFSDVVVSVPRGSQGMWSPHAILHPDELRNVASHL